MGQAQARQTHCIHGHEFTPENTWKTKHGQRHCRECGRLRMKRRRTPHRLDVVAALDEAVRAWAPSVRAVDLAWSAGIFEGEGTICARNRAKQYPQILALLANTDHEVVQHFQTYWPGTMRAVAPRRATHRASWVWELQQRHAAVFLEQIAPYVKRTITKAKLGLALEIERLTRESRWQRLPADRVQPLIARMYQLNQRGPNPFLAHVVLPGGQTLGAWAVPQIEEAYRTGRVPALLPGAAQEPVILLGPGEER